FPLLAVSSIPIAYSRDGHRSYRRMKKKVSLHDVYGFGKSKRPKKKTPQVAAPPPTLAPISMGPIFPKTAPTAPTPTPTPGPQPPPPVPPAPGTDKRPYPKGVWSVYRPGLPLGIVGATVSDDWDSIEMVQGHYDWTGIDSIITKALNDGFQKLILLIGTGSAKTPQWLLNALPADQKVSLLDPAPNHDTFCQPINTPLYWNTTYHQARLALISAAGGKYANHPNIFAVNIA